MRVKVIGAGSIGNHLAQASRRAGWNVVVVDKDQEALRRMKEEIYPARYGSWDGSIKLYESKNEPKGRFDVVFIGTPPDSHLPIATRILREEPPRVLQIEKPLCPPTLNGLQEFLEEAERHPATNIVVGYDHVLGENTKIVEELMKAGGSAESELGRLLTLDVDIRFDWQPILKAHPWLKGPHETYLGDWKRGGGAGGEHSHGINLWQHFAYVAGLGKVVEVSAVLDYAQSAPGVCYDRLCFITLRTEEGLTGRVAQDVVTYPEDKKAVLQYERGRIEWYLGFTKDTDRVVKRDKDGVIVQDTQIHKKRPDDFFLEIKHIEGLINGSVAFWDSPIRLERGLHSMYILEAAHRLKQSRQFGFSP